MAKSVVYVADPMCSWCYGFAPQLDEFLTKHDVALDLVMGGLWPGKRAPVLDEGLVHYLRETWERVGALTSQPFDMARLDRLGWIYDTEPACRAVVTMRTQAPGQEYEFFAALQAAFYADGTDLTDDHVYEGLLAGFPVDVADFMLALRSTEMAEATQSDFYRARELGALGFPTLLLDADGARTPLTRGYANAKQIDRVYEVLAAS